MGGFQIYTLKKAASAPGAHTFLWLVCLSFLLTASNGVSATGQRALKKWGPETGRAQENDPENKVKN